MRKIGLIGLGIMGAPMAANTVKGGCQLYACSRSGVPQELVAVGAVACKTGKEVAEQADCIITMVPDTPPCR